MYSGILLTMAFGIIAAALTSTAVGTSYLIKSNTAIMEDHLYNVHFAYVKAIEEATQLANDQVMIAFVNCLLIVMGLMMIGWLLTTLSVHNISNGPSIRMYEWPVEDLTNNMENLHISYDSDNDPDYDPNNDPDYDPTDDSDNDEPVDEVTDDVTDDVTDEVTDDVTDEPVGDTMDDSMDGMMGSTFDAMAEIANEMSSSNNYSDEEWTFPVTYQAPNRTHIHFD